MRYFLVVFIFWCHCSRAVVINVIAVVAVVVVVVVDACGVGPTNLLGHSLKRASPVDKMT